MHKCVVSDIKVEFEKMQGSFNQVQVNNNIKKRPIKHEFMVFGMKLNDLQSDLNK
jgi:hypothetical protein